jgi:glycosyltransferase involved in cell wall biosynthesis
VADIYLSLSEHEGFCVPLVEAMNAGVPVVAYETGAVRETLRGGGVLLREKGPALVAELLHQLRRDDALRREVLLTQQRAMAVIRATDFGAVLLERLGPVLA